MTAPEQYGWCHHCETIQRLSDAIIGVDSRLEEADRVLQFLENTRLRLPLEPLCVDVECDQSWAFGIFGVDVSDMPCVAYHAERQDVFYGGPACHDPNCPGKPPAPAP